MIENGGTQLPCGFRGSVAGWAELQSRGARVLRLPAEGIPDGPFLHLPDGEFDLIEVCLTESMGRIEGFLPQVASRLAPSGTCILEVENPQAPRYLRLALEGVAGARSPSGSLLDPAARLPLMRVLTAIEGAGLLLQDCIRVPSHPAELDPVSARALFEEGFKVLEYLRGVPPWKHWVICQKLPVLAGSALVGSGSAEQQRVTEECLRAFLPSDWQLLPCSGSREVTGFNRAVPTSSGELVWFLRAGATVDEVLFQRLCAATLFCPAIPGCDGVASNPGDISGLMLSRSELLAAGPVPESWESAQVAYEDWNMLLQARVTAPGTETGGFRTPPVSGEALPVVEREGRELLDLWDTEVSSRVAAGEEEPQPPDVLQDAPRISLCMIVKNEERFLGECLELAAPAVDEIIVVDTGSTDRTVEIAESYGAKVLHVPWQDDFSAPRNRSLEAATGNWILVLDADERLQPGAGEKIRELVRNPKVSGYHLVFRNRYSDGKTLGVLMVRLFRKLSGIAYEKRVHEQVTISLVRESAALGLVLGMSDLEVIHEGYTDQLMAQRSKNERNERLFNLQLREDPADIYSRYKYGDFLRRIPGRNRDARAALEETLDLIHAQPPSVFREIPWAGEVAALCALEYAREGHTAKALEIVEAALRQFIPTPNLHYIAASLALAIDRNDEAIAHYRQCFRYRGDVLIVPIQEGITDYVSITGLAQAWLQKGDRVKARGLLNRSIAIRPDYDVSHMALSKLCFEEGDVVKALAVLSDYLTINPDSPGVCHQATLILRTMGLTDQARRMGERALQLMDDGALEYESENLRRTMATLC